MIYFAQCRGLEGDNGPIKIGFTNKEPMVRVKRIQVDNPYQVKLLGYGRGDSLTEKWLHRHLIDHHLQGEWFRPHQTVWNVIEDFLADFRKN